MLNNALAIKSIELEPLFYAVVSILFLAFQYSSDSKLNLNYWLQGHTPCIASISFLHVYYLLRGKYT